MSPRCSKYLVLLAALVLMVPLSSFARSKNERKVTLPDAMQVGSTQLKAGTYKVEWQGNGSSLHVSFLDNGKTIATTQGKMVEKNKRTPFDAFVTSTAGNAKKLMEIDFGGTRDALVLSSSQTQTAMK
jgi:hypothetical protein